MGGLLRRQTPGFSVVDVSIAIAYSWLRMLFALGLSIIFGMIVGILAARNRRAETIVVPLLDVFQSIPILGFFPLVIFGIVSVFPGAPWIGVNLAVIFLIFTSMSWNIAFGVYEAVKSIPQDYLDLLEMSRVGLFHKIRSLYIPASISRIAYNSQTSWAVGLFYLVTSEIFSLGTKNFQVSNGIGVTIIGFLQARNYTGYVYSVVLLLIAVAVWQVVFLREFSLWGERFKFAEEPLGARRDPLLRFYAWVNARSISKLFLLRPIRGVGIFGSVVRKYRRGLLYALGIMVVVFLAFEVGAAVTTSASRIRIPSISAVGATEARVLVALGYSFLRVWYVYFIAVLVGVPLGISVALRGRLYEAVTPVLEVVGSIPAPALLPAIYVVAEGAGETVAAFVIFLGMIWYIVFNSMAGIRTLPREIFELRRVFGISRLQAWRHIYLPASATAFITGSITAIGAAWNTLIVAEYFQVSGVQTQVGIGIGKDIVLATNSNDLLTLTLAVLSMTALIVVFNLTVWRRVYQYATKRYAYNR